MPPDSAELTINRRSSVRDTLSDTDMAMKLARNIEQFWRETEGRVVRCHVERDPTTGALVVRSDLENGKPRKTPWPA